MSSTHKEFWIAVLTDTVKPGVCLEQAGWAMRVPNLGRIDQTTRNGP